MHIFSNNYLGIFARAYTGNAELTQFLFYICVKYVFLPELNEHNVIIHCVIGVLLMDYEHLHVDCSGWR